jgi:hypothetical protein
MVKMKAFLFTNLFFIILGSLLTVDQVYSPNSTDFLEKINIYRSRINPANQSVKTLVLDSVGLACWLSETGQLHSINDDTARHIILNKSNREWENVTYIEDFCLDAANDRIYFTDIMDLVTGRGAIKVSDLRGNDLKTLLTFQDEIPYQVNLSSSGKLLFYLSQRNFRDASYQLRVINLDNGERGTLHSSNRKISKLNIDHSLELLSIADPEQGQLTFTTTTYNTQILADATP